MQPVYRRKGKCFDFREGKMHFELKRIKAYRMIPDYL